MDYIYLGRYFTFTYGTVIGITQTITIMDLATLRSFKNGICIRAQSCSSANKITLERQKESMGMFWAGQQKRVNL